VRLDGTMSVKKRSKVVDRFNDPAVSLLVSVPGSDLRHLIVIMKPLFELKCKKISSSKCHIIRLVN